MVSRSVGEPQACLEPGRPQVGRQVHGVGEEAGKEGENFSSRSSQTPAGGPGNPGFGEGVPAQPGPRPGLRARLQLRAPSSAVPAHCPRTRTRVSDRGSLVLEPQWRLSGVPLQRPFTGLLVTVFSSVKRRSNLFQDPAGDQRRWVQSPPPGPLCCSHRMCHGLGGGRRGCPVCVSPGAAAGSVCPSGVGVS